METKQILQKDIISKERRIFDLERQLLYMNSELNKLKTERDRLVQISAELKAELNKVKRSASEYQRLQTPDVAMQTTKATAFQD